MIRTISNNDDIIDSRDIIARIEELEALEEAVTDAKNALEEAEESEDEDDDELDLDDDEDNDDTDDDEEKPASGSSQSRGALVGLRDGDAAAAVEEKGSPARFNGRSGMAAAEATEGCDAVRSSMTAAL